MQHEPGDCERGAGSIGSPIARLRELPIPNIVLFSGGTACRSINLALCRKGAAVTRIVPASDSGGSSKIIRERLGILPVGDIRQALMTMAHGEGRAGEIVKICNARLSDSGTPGDLAREFTFYVSGNHPLIAAMDPVVRTAIIRYLGRFAATVGSDFDLRNGSIGNFILTGAFLEEDGDINAAIEVFRNLCGISGNVWPVTADNTMTLAAVLRDSRRIEGQHAITRLHEDDARIGIGALEIDASGSQPRASNAVLAAIAKADLIVFGPGSFFTSLLPHAMVDGIAEAVMKNVRAKKIFVSNVLEDAETVGRSVAELLGILAQAGIRFDTAIIHRDSLPLERSTRGFRYVRAGLPRIPHISADFEDAWDRGRHDGAAMAAILLQLSLM